MAAGAVGYTASVGYMPSSQLFVQNERQTEEDYTTAVLYGSANVSVSPAGAASPLGDDMRFSSSSASASTAVAERKYNFDVAAMAVTGGVLAEDSFSGRTRRKVIDDDDLDDDEKDEHENGTLGPGYDEYDPLPVGNTPVFFLALLLLTYTAVKTIKRRSQSRA